MSISNTEHRLIVVRIRLVKKFARFLNGVDLDGLSLGECVDVPDSVARMLVREGWAELPETPIAHAGEIVTGPRGEES